MLQEFGRQTTPPIASAPPLEAPAPSGSFVKDALYLAVREAQIGNPAQARAEIKVALVQLDNVGDPTEKAYWADQVTQTTAYVESLAGQAEQLQVASQQADAVYVRGQSLTPAELVALNNDNADTARALDAEARGENVTLAYNKGPVERGVAAASGAIASTAGGVLGAALGPWSWALAIGAVVFAAVTAGYGYFYFRAARAAKGAVTK